MLNISPTNVGLPLATWKVARITDQLSLDITAVLLEIESGDTADGELAEARHSRDFPTGLAHPKTVNFNIV